MELNTEGDPNNLKLVDVLSDDQVIDIEVDNLLQ